MYYLYSILFSMHPICPIRKRQGDSSSQLYLTLKVTYLTNHPTGKKKKAKFSEYAKLGPNL